MRSIISSVRGISSSFRANDESVDPGAVGSSDGKAATRPSAMAQIHLISNAKPSFWSDAMNLAVIQSTEASKRIEGVVAPPERIRELVERKWPLGPTLRSCSSSTGRTMTTTS
jgi:hypothetical protein